MPSYSENGLINQTLPVDMFCLLFSLLPLPDLLSVFQVCRHWHSIATREEIWRDKWFATLKNINKRLPETPQSQSNTSQQQFFNYHQLFHKLPKRSSFFFWEESWILELEDSNSLHSSVLNGQIDLIAFLLSSNINVDSELTIGKKSLRYLNITPLGLAVLEGEDHHIPIVKLLLAHGADSLKPLHIIQSNSKCARYFTIITTEKSQSLLKISQNPAITCLLFLDRAERHLLNAKYPEALNCYQESKRLNTKIFNEYFETVRTMGKGLGQATLDNAAFLQRINQMQNHLEYENRTKTCNII